MEKRVCRSRASQVTWCDRKSATVGDFRSQITVICLLLAILFIFTTLSFTVDVLDKELAPKALEMVVLSFHTKNRL